jgi:uncharacterized protein YndB with AHSA1/START domain
MRMKNKDHGVTYVYSNSERDYLINLGWELDEEKPVVVEVKQVTLEVTPEKTPSEQYEEKFGKPPHHRMKEEGILKALNDNG